jgi:hypothetical protein
VSHSDRCGFGNQDSPCSCAALATLRNRLEASGIASLEAEVARKDEALRMCRTWLRDTPNAVAIIDEALSQHTRGEDK